MSVDFCLIYFILDLINSSSVIGPIAKEVKSLPFRVLKYIFNILSKFEESLFEKRTFNKFLVSKLPLIITCVI